ncbi:MAG: hypothetical protein QF497_07315 [Verrucomicrobiota bacterium]|jgi:hypothetical protein|nr:hypothetical protein [Verrucomicrobiota bacterium]|tara:strand:+ start:481 stop:651 length:171 start_codon:yes stop_codon:yes gene_type:complete
MLFLLSPWAVRAGSAQDLAFCGARLFLCVFDLRRFFGQLLPFEFPALINHLQAFIA